MSSEFVQCHEVEPIFEIEISNRIVKFYEKIEKLRSTKCEISVSLNPCLIGHHLTKEYADCDGYISQDEGITINLLVEFMFEELETG